MIYRDRPIHVAGWATRFLFRADQADYRSSFGPNWSPDSRWIVYRKPGENQNDAIYLSAEAGVEVFIRRSMALDLSGRVMVHQSRELDYPYPIEDLNSPKHTNREFRLVAGLHFYVLD